MSDIAGREIGGDAGRFDRSYDHSASVVVSLF